jgi:hypothetical protein
MFGIEEIPIGIENLDNREFAIATGQGVQSFAERCPRRKSGLDLSVERD